MIFKTVNSKIEKTAYDITIKNIDLSGGHWGSEKEIINYLDEIDSFSYDEATFTKNIILHALRLKKENFRIKNLEFYRIPEENKLIILATTMVARMKEVPPFEREFNIQLKRNSKLCFSIIELLEIDRKDLEKDGKGVPANWIVDEYLTTRYGRLKEYL
jgi:hypothetical protein